MLAKPPRNNGTQKEVQKTGFARFLSATFIIVVYYGAKVMLPSFKHIFVSEFL